MTPKPTIICAEWLKGTAGNKYSQFGEDGLLKTVFEKIGIENEWCFEVGAYDGVTFANTRCFNEQGWNGVLIESDDTAYEALVHNYAEMPHVQCIKGYVEPWTIDAMLRNAGLPWNADLGVLDIDEQEFWVWSGMHYTHPRVMVVEYAYTRPSHQVPPIRMDRGDPVWQTQAGRDMIWALGICKGYQLVAQTTSNMIFVVNEVLNAAFDD